jgi:phospholipid/cholesterol/gamma-HCH transport system substrate-binding protein
LLLPMSAFAASTGTVLGCDLERPGLARKIFGGLSRASRLLSSRRRPAHFSKGSAVPSRKEIQWTQLRVGALVLTALAVLVGLIILMSGSSGGLFARKLVLRAYFKNANGLKDGAEVTLEGVTIGNVVHVRVIPERDPTPVEVSVRVGDEFKGFLHTDSTAAIVQAGVLGDSFVDISSVLATGPAPTNNAELKTTGAPSIQDVIQSSQVSIGEINALTKKLEILMDSINSGKGTIGALVNDPALAHKFTAMASDLQTITSAIATGKGSLGKLVNDDTLYARANSTIDRLNKIATDLDDGKGTAGKFLKDDSLYKNLNSTVSNANDLLAQVNAGKGSIGKLAKDPEFAKKLDDTVTRLDNILKDVNEGKGTIGQLAQNRSLYDHADNTLDQAEQLVKAMRENPKKYLVVQLKIF